MAFYPCVLSWVTDNTTALGLFSDTCTIYEPPAPTLADKGQAPSATYPGDWTALVTDEPCSFYAIQSVAREGATAGQIKEMGDFRLIVRVDMARPSGKAKVRINSLDYEIVGIRDGSDLFVMTIDLKRAK